MEYVDYASMQEAARKRVLEMQRRSRDAVAGCAQTKERSAEPEDAYERFYELSGCDITDRKENAEAELPPPEKHESAKAGGSDECERLLIGSLLLLLIAEGADAGIAAALLYLLSE